MQHTCSAYTGQGQLCGHQAILPQLGQVIPEHLHFCGVHARAYTRNFTRVNQHHQDGKCRKFLTTHRWCPRDDAGNGLCQVHRRAIRRAETRRMNDTIVREAVNILRNTVPPLTWQAVAREYHHENLPHEMSYRIALQYYYTTANPTLGEFRNFWLGLNGLPPVEAVPPPIPVLAILSRDAQNVHTAPVSAQTNAGMEKLLATNVPKTQTTEMAMMKSWIVLKPSSWNEMLRVINDVNKWFNTKTCRAENDTLYRRVLRGLVATLEATKDAELNTELYKRLWQECQESVGLCCEGHLTRLCNVMVGFDDTFTPPVALGELMQQKMAAISGLDVSEEEKRRQANAWFDEVAVPQEERVAWLEAF